MHCSVSGCSVNASNSPADHLFAFPKQEDLKELWLQRVGITDSVFVLGKRKRLFVCQQHFDTSDYHIVPVKSSKFNVRYKLDKNIVPHKNLPAVQDAERYCFMIPKSDPLARPLEIKHCDSQRVNIKPAESIQCSPKKCIQPVDQNTTTATSPTGTFSTPGSESTGILSSVGSEYFPSNRSENEFAQEQCQTEDKLKSLNFTYNLMKEKSMQYLGIPSNGTYVLQSLQETTNISERDIMIILRKIRLNETFELLSDSFGLSRSRISHIFNENVPKIAREFEELIFWPDAKAIKKFLPFAFLPEHSAVQSIIDCFEIQIQKPTDPVAQSVTYSQYKSCNTIKYLVSCTPCGHVNFISKGFPGRASDQKIVRNSGFLNHVHENVGVLADRGFKNVAVEVAQKGGNLIRPPSVTKDEALSKKDALKAKEIASTRIHVERLIRRFREFRMCAPHAELPSYFLHNLDSIVIIVAGLVNLQGPLIK